MKLSILCLPCVALSLFPLTLLGFCFGDAGEKYGISPALLESVARVESNLNPKAINMNKNGSYDIGLMQINSGWLQSLKVETSDLLNDACFNTMTGALILRQCIDRHGYTWEAVGCYNAMSRDKKVNYAWKVFHQLENERRKPAANRLRGTAHSKSNREYASKDGGDGTSSLVFRVRDIAEAEEGAP